MDDLAKSRREQVLAAIVAAGPAGISGERLAQDLGCSRASVHRHVQALRRDGTGIEGGHEGYVLAAGADPVVASIVQAGCRAPIAGPVVWIPSTGSTNDDAAALARGGAAEGLVVGADHQTAGRGRRGRTWLSDPTGGLTFSVLLRPRVDPLEAGLFPLVVAVAVAEAIGPQATIVWPNDIVVDGRKVCGILCESSLDESGVAWAIAGIGINVGAVPVVDDARWRPGAVAAVHAVRRMDLLRRVLDSLGDRYAEWVGGDGGAIIAAYRARDALAGATVTVETARERIVATAAGTDELGRLRLRTGAGEIALGSGEVVRLER